MKLSAVRKLMSSEARKAALKRRLVQLLEGHELESNPGPEMVILEEPTCAKMRIYWDGFEEPCRVGRYSSINYTVTFMPGMGHPLNAVTTFFFYYQMGGIGEPEVTDKLGPVIVGNDVWMGREVLVMGGVTVGDGAVVASRAVVTKDVAPYEIVGGIPARHIGWRFDEQTREELLRIAWWDWPVEKVLAHRTQLYWRGDGVVDFIARHGGKVDAMASAEPCEVCDKP